jgi:hypothetical protein
MKALSVEGDLESHAVVKVVRDGRPELPSLVSLTTVPGRYFEWLDQVFARADAAAIHEVQYGSGIG